MNTKRYVAAGAVSLLVHSMFLAAMPTKDPITLTMGTDTPRVSLTFAAIPPAVVDTPPPAATPTMPTVSTPVKTPVVSTMKRLAKTNTTNKVVTKKTPTPPKKITKTAKSTATVTKKKHVTPKKTKTQQSQPIANKITHKEKKPLNPIKTITNQLNTKTLATTSTAGAQTLQLVSKPTFATRPGAVNYPKLAKRRGIEGQVLIEVWIGTKGQQLKQKLIKSSGAHILDKAALTAIKKWHFSSHIVNGKAIAHRVQIPVRFKLD